jgi:DNA repair exonuclease SbcCD nuclease subunit
MKIAHIADVHFRGLSRHDEAKVVFETFFQDARKNNVEHIFIAGDIWHTKSQGITAEFVDLFCWWLNALTSVSDVHMILGNHDFNVINKSRHDIVSAIVTALNNPKIHLYKHSGVYEFAPGFNWCVFSIYDDNWDVVKPTPGHVNIACYHGPVRGSKTESDWDVEEGLDVNFFKDYDLCFLGDIHRQQFLDFRDVELIVNEDQLSKYPDAEVLEVLDEK